MLRIGLTSLAIAAALLGQAPARAADLSGNLIGVPAGAVHAEPYVIYDFEPGVVIRAYWLTPWAGRHYFPSGGTLPMLGRHEELKPVALTGQRNFHREWTSFPIDIVRQPPLILNQQQYFPRSSAAPVTPELSK
jgi:hypothetical protein